MTPYSAAVHEVEARESKVRSRRYSSVEIVAVFGPARWREPLQAEAIEQQEWDQYESVSHTMLGRRLNPPADARTVIKLLNAAGLTVKNDDKTWGFTKAGLEYVIFEAPEASKVPWAAWSKTVLPVLQATLDRTREAEPAPS